VRPAVIVVDMLEDSYRNRTPEREEVKIIAPVCDFLKACRSRFIPVIYACDSFLADDFIFKGRMKPHAIRGTEGAKVLSDLDVEASDIVLPKRRFSAFFKTDLDQTLRTLHVDTVAVAGINTHFCVLATAFDAVCHDFYTIILEDLSAAYKREIHDSCINAYRSSAIFPLLRIATSVQFLDDLDHDKNAL
jgi:nicotinamidase/pyrazinamidase